MKEESIVDICKDLMTPAIATCLIPAFTSAYGMAVSAAESIDFLGKWDLQEQILPYLKNWAVEYELLRRSRQGIIPFGCDVIPNSRKNHRHIELHRNGYILTVSQIHHLTSLPRECIFRNDHCLDGQFVMSGFGEGANGLCKEVYAIMTHGQGMDSPSFICCGIPAPNMKSWAQHVNLFDVVKGLSIVDESPITEDIKLDYRESIQESVKELKRELQ